MSTLTTMEKSWCLVMVLWGDKYGAEHINAIVENLFQNSLGCAQVILKTDRLRDGMDGRVRQVLIATEFDRADFKQNYTIKLSLFDPRALPPSMPCVYIDLDTVVTGDLGKIAGLVRQTDDLFMLPPGGLIGFGSIRRRMFQFTRGRRIAKGNSSVLAFHSDMQPNLAMEFLRLKNEGGAPARVLQNDDLFISWFGQMRLQAVPTRLAVMFRREFLNRSRWYGWIRNRLPWVKSRRESLVAVTFNGVEHKLEKLLQLPDDALHHDSKGRAGYLSRAEMGPIRDKIARAALGLLKTPS